MARTPLRRSILRRSDITKKPFVLLTDGFLEIPPQATQSQLFSIPWAVVCSFLRAVDLARLEATCRDLSLASAVAWKLEYQKLLQAGCVYELNSSSNDPKTPVLQHHAASRYAERMEFLSATCRLPDLDVRAWKPGSLDYRVFVRVSGSESLLWQGFCPHTVHYQLQHNSSSLVLNLSHAAILLEPIEWTVVAASRQGCSLLCATGDLFHRPPSFLPGETLLPLLQNDAPDSVVHVGLRRDRQGRVAGISLSCPKLG